MKTKAAMLLPAVAILAGCASMQPMLWVKPGGEQQEFDSAKYECMQVEHQVDASTPDPCANAVNHDNCQAGNNLGIALARLSNPYAGTPGQQMFNSCMTAHGWHLQPRSTATPFSG